MAGQRRARQGEGEMNGERPETEERESVGGKDESEAAHRAVAGCPPHLGRDGGRDPLARRAVTAARRQVTTWWRSSQPARDVMADIVVSAADVLDIFS